MDDAVEHGPSDPGRGRLAPSGRAHRWSLRVGRDGISWSSVRESYGPHGFASVSANRRLAAGPALVTAAGGLALLLAGATAGRAWSTAPTQAGLAMVVPDARPFVTAPARPVRAHRAAGGRRRTPIPDPAMEQGEPFAGAGPIPDRAQAIDRALRTGEFQEWAGRSGVTGFAVPGPAETGPAGICRPLAVLTRQPDGQDSVANSRVCTPAAE